MNQAPAKPRVYLNAFFCNKVIRDERNILTAIELTDGYIVNPVRIIPRNPDGTLDEVHPLIAYEPMRFAAVVIIRTEGPREFILTLKGTQPSGTPMNVNTAPFAIRCEGGAEGHTLNIGLNVVPIEEGDYWFEIYVDDLLHTKIPLRVKRGTQFSDLQQIPEWERLSPPSPSSSE